MITTKRNARTGLTDKEFSSHFASPKSVSKYSLEEGLKRAALRDATLSPLLKAGISYEQAATLADQVVREAFGS